MSTSKKYLFIVGQKALHQGNSVILENRLPQEYSELSSKPLYGLNIRRHSARQWHFMVKFLVKQCRDAKRLLNMNRFTPKKSALSISTLRTHKIRYLQTYCSRPSYNCQSWINELPSHSQSSAKWSSLNDETQVDLGLSENGAPWPDGFSSFSWLKRVSTHVNMWVNNHAIYVYICMYVWMYVCTYVRMYECTHVCMYVCT